LEQAFYFVSEMGSINKAQNLDDRGMKEEDNYRLEHQRSEHCCHPLCKKSVLPVGDIVCYQLVNRRRAKDR